MDLEVAFVGLRATMGSGAELALALGVDVVRVGLVLATGMVLNEVHLGAMGLVGNHIPLADSGNAPYGSMLLDPGP